MKFIIEDRMIRRLIIIWMLLLGILSLCKSTFLEEGIHSMESLYVGIDGVEQEYDFLKISERNNGTIFKIKRGVTERGCWSLKILDSIDMNEETENKFMRVQMLRLNSTSLSIIGVDSVESNPSHISRIFIQSEGKIGYCYKNEISYTKSGLKMRVSHMLGNSQNFSFEQNDIIEIIYLAQDQSLLLYNLTKQNLFSFPRSLLAQVGTHFKIIIGISDPIDLILINSTT